MESFLQYWPGEWKDISDSDAPHEAATLSLAIGKAAQHLEWRPVWNFDVAGERTARWYHQCHVVNAEDLHGLCLAQLETYAADALEQSLVWAR